MGTGLGQALITFTPGVTARSADVNSNLQALNNAANYSFTSAHIDPSQTSDASFRGLKMLNATDFGLLNNTSANWLRIASGLTTASKVVICDTSLNQHFGFWSDSSYDYLDCGNASFRVRTSAGNNANSAVNAMRLTASNLYSVSGSSYGLVAAANAIFNQGSGNADVAEPLLTEGDVQPGMALCCSENDTVSPCTHDACRIAKIFSTSPTILLSARIENDEDMTPIAGHESAKPIVIGGVAPILMVPDSGVKLRDRVTPSGNNGLLRVARDDEYALGDIIKIEQNVIYAWIHY